MTFLLSVFLWTQTALTAIVQRRMTWLFGSYVYLYVLTKRKHTINCVPDMLSEKTFFQRWNHMIPLPETHYEEYDHPECHEEPRYRIFDSDTHYDVDSAILRLFGWLHGSHTTVKALKDQRCYTLGPLHRWSRFEPRPWPHTSEDVYIYKVLVADTSSHHYSV